MPASQKEKDQISDILEKVRRQENAVGPLFERMDGDWMLYNLTPFKTRPGDGIRQEEVFTSNRPKVFADKLAGSIAAAKMIVRTEQDADNKEQRDQDNNYERFGIGAFKKASRQRERDLGVPILTELAHRAIVRGGYVAARALLLKDENGETIPDVTPIDPRHLLIQKGARGPSWAAIVTLRSRETIRNEYPGFKFDDEDDPGASQMGDNQRTERVIDYYWRETGKTNNGKFMNAVIVDGQFAKKPADTFSVVFPVIARAIGGHSGTAGENISLAESAGGTPEVPGIVHFAESAFAPIRKTNAYRNLLQSYRMVMTRKSVRGINKVYSRDGTKELEDDLDEDATEVNLATENEEEVVPMEVRELTRDIEVLSQELALEETDGTVPESSLGRIPGPLSGNAIRLLAAAEGQRLEPFLRPIESCIEGIIEALAAQFETGSYKPIKVSGKTRDRRGFSRDITPQDIAGHDEISVKLVPILPQDTQEKWLTAQLASTPGANGMPLQSHDTIWDEILELQDADLEKERIMNQMTRTSSEKQLLMSSLIAATNAGEEEAAQFLGTDLQRVVRREAMEEMAQRIAFISMMFQNPLAAAVVQGGGQGGEQGGGQAGGAGAQNGSAPSPLGIDPRFVGLSGVAPGSVNPSPDAGANTANERESLANQAGITLASPAQVRQFG